MQPQDPSQPLNNPENRPSEQAPAPQPSGEAAGGEPQAMYYSRPLEPNRPVISPAIQQKCEESKRKYPKLNLSEGEYVISDIKRHPIGLVGVWFLSGFAIVAIIALVALASASGWGIPPAALGLGAILLCTLVMIGAYIATFVYNANTFRLTNESVVQNIQTSLFTNHEQTVSLGNVEDASYEKSGILQAMFDYGTVRLSTQGDETTYRFTYAAHPSRQIAQLNNAVEAFKNGRPVRDDDDD